MITEEQKVLEILVQRFQATPVEKTFTAQEVLHIIKATMESYITPLEIKEAVVYNKSCESDLGFMGSPKYDQNKKLIEEYLKSKVSQQELEAKKKLYEQLKQEFEHE